jgi:hypothetical protein
LNSFPLHTIRDGVKEATPDQTVWYLVAKLEVDQQAVMALAKKRAAFSVATNILDAQRLPHEQVISTSKEQGRVERGLRLLKDPLFLASSVFVKKPERVIALSFVMVLCLLVYRLAEHLLRLNWWQHNKPFLIRSTNRPTAPRCAGFSSVLRALISCTCAVVPASQTRCWGCKLSIDRFFVCLVLHIHTSILSLRKLRKVESGNIVTLSAHSS